VGQDRVLTVPPTQNAPALLLRPWAEHDADAIVEAHRDPVMRQWLRNRITNTADAHQMIRARQADAAAGIGYGFAVLQVEPGQPDDLVGSVSLRGLHAAAVAGEIGYWVAAAARGRGVAPRAVEAVTTWAFGLPRKPPLERLELLHSVGNLASCRVAEKTGFRLSAVLPPLLPDFPDDGHLHVRSARG
jgi:RimJ/RimL family protein N-acetyltransferase